MKLLFAIFIFSISSISYSYNVEPFRFNTHKTTFYEGSLHFFSKIRSSYSDPVHENITIRAQKCALNEECRIQKLGFIPLDTNPLIVGVRWNDDPLDLIPGNLSGFASRFKGGKKAAKKNKIIGPTYSMLSRSHFGDMQFIHSMANKDREEFEVVRERILLWAKFTYSIAIGLIDTNKQLSDTIMNEYFPIWKGDCTNQGNPTCISNLFDPYGEKRKHGLNIKSIALGALLHTIQDSFSNSHVNRNDKGEIVAFYSYINQSELKHAKEDALPTWLKTGDWPKYNPISSSEKIIRFYMENKKTGVDNSEEFLDYVKKIYFPAKVTNKSDNGGYI